MAIMKSLVIIPAYNEQDSIGKVLQDLKKYFKVIDVLVISDGSTDQTNNLVKGLNVKLISHSINCGVGAAISTGFHYAISNGYKQIITMDADGQHDAISLSLILKELNQKDLVIGERNWERFNTSFIKTKAVRLLVKILKLTEGINVQDPTSGYRGFSISAAKVLHNSIGTEYLADTVLLLIDAKKAGLAYGCVQVEMNDRFGGKPSHGSIASALKYIGLIIRILLKALEK
jgi:glycosyltransferase involved in cell wall biosynthesis